MSANHHTACPRCSQRRDAELAGQQQQADSAYGNVSIGEYAKLVRDLEAARRKPLLYTLREEHEIGIRAGEFVVRYRAACQECGFEYEHNITEKV